MESNRVLSQYRLEQAERCLKSAETLRADNDYKGAANRSYYCVFHCMRSILALEGVDYKKHSALIAHFRKEYIKTGLLEMRLSDILAALFRVRTESDYDDYFIIGKEEVGEQIEGAAYFLAQVRRYLTP